MSFPGDEETPNDRHSASLILALFWLPAAPTTVRPKAIRYRMEYRLWLWSEPAKRWRHTSRFPLQMSPVERTNPPSGPIPTWVWAAESCLAAIYPGWRASFEMDGIPYEVRTDELGDIIRVNDE